MILFTKSKIDLKKMFECRISINKYIKKSKFSKSLKAFNLYYSLYNNTFHRIFYPRTMYLISDSLCYEIVTEDVYKDMESMQHLFDTSNYDPTKPLFSNQNKKIPGKFKDELSGKY